MKSLVFVLAAAVGLSAAAWTSSSYPEPWGGDLHSLRGDFTRSVDLTERAAGIAPLDQTKPFSLRFRFQTVDQGSYAGIAFIGVRKAGGGFMTNSAGTMIHRHNDDYGLIGYPFICDGAGTLHHRKAEFVKLEYGTCYDAVCIYSPGQRCVTTEFFHADTGNSVGKASMDPLPPEATFAADRLACWNYADGHNERSRLSLLIDNLQLSDAAPLTFAKGLEELPLGDDKRFSLHKADPPPVISEFSAPDDLFAEDAALSATVRPGVTGALRFALTTYAGESLWQEEAQIVDGKATATLPGAALAKLEKGSRVLQVALADAEEEAVCRALRLRGRVFANVLEAPGDLRAGDEIIITDLTPLQPEEAVSAHSEKGKWWWRPYSTPDGEQHHLVCVEEQDTAEPQSCIAPSIRLPLNLEGWYEIWVRTYRHDIQGGIDVRLSGEPYFFHADPLQISTTPDTVRPPEGALVDIRYRAADLTGQELIFQQPFGTFNSAELLANASLAGVRLVKLSDKQAARLTQERARADVRLTGYDNDGFSYFHFWAVHDPACIARLLEPLRDQSAAFFNFSLGGLGGLSVPTPYTGVRQMVGHTRYGDYRANAFYQWCFDNDVNVVDVLAKRAHELGLKLFVSTMMERCFSPDKTFKSHPEWLITKGRGRWNYALQEVKDFQVKKIAWIMEHCDIDGFMVDYTRYGYYFNADEPDKFGHMNDFLRALRAAADAVNAKKERKVMLCASFGDESTFIKHWGTGKLTDQGLDVDTWIEEGLFDMIMPEGPSALRWVEKAKGTKAAVWPRKCSGYSFLTDKKMGGKMGPKQIEQGAMEFYDAGAPGIFFFNHEPWSTLGRLGFREELPLRLKTGEIYGMREGPVVEFAAWYPSVEARKAQREAFNPVPVPSDMEGRDVDRSVAIPVRNTFDRPVEANISCLLPENGGWRVEPASVTLKLGPKQQTDAVFRITGKAAGQSEPPAFNAVFRAGGEDVFRHRIPARAGRRIGCDRVPGVPDRNEPQQLYTLTGAVDAQKEAMLQPGEYDDDKLCIRVWDFPKGAKQNVCLFLDVDGSELKYYDFRVNSQGEESQVLWVYEQFMGHHVRKKLEAEWNVAVDKQGDGEVYYTLTVPFETLGRRPEPGDIWRMNVAVLSEGEEAEESIQSWATPSLDYADPEQFGSILFEE